MKITIDTKEDSHDEIKETIKMLQNLVGDNASVASNQNIQKIVEEKKDEKEKEVVNVFENLFNEARDIKEDTLEAKEEESTEADELDELIVTDKNSRYDMKTVKESEIPKPIKTNTEEIIRIIEY